MDSFFFFIGKSAWQECHLFPPTCARTATMVGGKIFVKKRMNHRLLITSFPINPNAFEFYSLLVKSTCLHHDSMIRFTISINSRPIPCKETLSLSLFQDQLTFFLSSGRMVLSLLGWRVGRRMDSIETWQFPNERLRNRLCRGTPLVTIESRYRVVRRRT